MNEPRDWSKLFLLAALTFLVGLCVWQRLGVIERLKAQLTEAQRPTPRERAIYRIDAEGLLTPWERAMLLRAEAGLPVWREPKGEAKRGR